MELRSRTGRRLAVAIVALVLADRRTIRRAQHELPEDDTFDER